MRRTPPAAVLLPAALAGAFALLVHLLAVSTVGGGFGVAESLHTADFESFYLPVARALAEGHGPTLDGEPAVRYPPGFPLALAAALGAGEALGLSEAASIRGLLALCVAASGSLLFLLARRFLGTVGGLVAALLWGAYPPVVVLSTRAVSTTPFLVLFLLACLAWVAARQRLERAGAAGGTWGLALAAGVLTGAAALVRPAALLLPLPLLALLWPEVSATAATRRRRAGLGLCLLLAHAATLGPWMLWSHAQIDRWIPLSTGGRLSLLDGLTVSAKDDREGPALPPRVDALMHAVQEERSSIRSPGDAVTFLLARDPLGAAQLLAVKAARSWYATDSLRHEGVLLALQAVYLALALGGLVLAWRRGGVSGRRLVALVVPTTLYLWALTILVLSILRYMLPAMALTMIPAALAVLAAMRGFEEDLLSEGAAASGRSRSGHGVGALASTTAQANRRHWLRKTGRRLLSSTLRGGAGGRLWRDDLANFTNLALGRRRARARCSVCGWSGVFLRHGGRRRQICLACGSRARHRALALALPDSTTLGDLAAPGDSTGAGAIDESRAASRGLHVAPEPCLRQALDGHAARWVRGDLRPPLDDPAYHLGLDLCRLPFPDDHFEWVVANHVLEHIVDDSAALREIYRVLKPGGLALLMVPVTAEETTDYGFVDPARNEHARDCGLDYFERYRDAGFVVDVERSDAMDGVEEYALLSEEGDGARTVHHVPFCRKPDGPRPEVVS